MQSSFDHSGIFASPITSGPFTFDGHMFEVDRISRCDSGRLYNLLTYVDPGSDVCCKAGKSCIRHPRHRDETGAFYEAQLVHYGLKRLKTKAAAKKALLAALEANGCKLDVPQEFQDLEQQLKTRFAVTNFLARQEYEREMADRQLQQQQQQLKRKREDDELMAEVSKAPKLDKSIAHNLTQLQGFYRISAPEISEGWDCHGPLTLQLGLSSAHSHMWGRFDFGIFEGTLRSRTPLKTDNHTIEFQWRGRETGEGESTFDDDNIAKFTFLQGGSFEGSMSWDCVGTFKLVGKKDMERSENETWSVNVPAWKSRYYELTMENHGAESAGRWGGIYYSRKLRQELNSDTESNWDDEDGDEDGDGDGDEDGDEDEDEDEGW